MTKNPLRRPFKYSFFNATLALIFINVAVFVFTYFNPNYVKYLALNPGCIILKKWLWQFVTYMFVHDGILHIFFNMLALFIFGISVERRLGSKEFLLFYFTCGILSGVLSFVVYLFTGGFYVFLMGASGAVYSVLLAYAVCFPRSTIYIWGIIPVPAPILVLIYAVIEIISQVAGGSNVAHFTHLFGFLIAFLYFIIRMGINPIKVWKNEL